MTTHRECSTITPLVGIVVLNYRGAASTLTCLRSIETLGYPTYRVIVVDNASGDGSVDQIIHGRPGVEVIESPKNLGYAGGNALGVRWCLNHGADYVWILNNDTQVMPDTLTLMVQKALAHPQAGIVGCVIRDERDPSRVLAMGGGRLFPLFARTWHVTKAMDSFHLDFLTGASLLIPTSVIRAIGFIREDFFLYWEDVDYCYRLRNHGYELVVALDASVLHDESSSMGKTSRLKHYYSTRSMVKFMYIHYPRTWFLTILLGFSWRIIKPLLHLDFGMCIVLLRALVDGVRGRFVEFKSGTL